MRGLLRKYDSLPLPAKAAFWFAVCSALQSGVSFLAIPFQTRLMSQEQYGIVTLYNSWRQIVIIFATLNIYSGVFNTGMVKWSNSRDAYLSSMVGLTAVLTAVTTVFYLVLQAHLNAMFQLTTSFVLVMMAQILASTVFSLWSARQRFEYRYVSILVATIFYTAASQAISIACTVFLGGPDDKALISVASLAVSTLVVAIVLTAVIARKSAVFIDLTYWKHAVLFNLPLVPHYLSTLILGQADRIMISSMVGTAEAAIYGVAYTIGLMIQVVAGAITNAVIPLMYEKLGKRDSSGISALVESLVLCVGIVDTLAILVAPEIMAIAAPPSYAGAVYVIPPVALSMLLAFTYGLFANVEFFYEKNLFIMAASLIAAVANVALNLFFIPLFGYLAAGYATLVCYGLLAFAHFQFASRVAREAGIIGLFRGGRITACLAFFALPAVVAISLYPYAIPRYAFVLILLAAAIWKRSAITSTLKQIKA